ncbi:MAG: chemotaxis-specific protein-glutamate methyltransferase CheB [Pseudomonadota bacterium]
MIKVLVVEDSAVARELICHILSSDREITVMGTAANGEEAVDFVSRHKPDVITMDIIMPKMDGFQATRAIMETNPVPIVIVSASLVKEEVEKTWRAVEAGAVAALEKPRYSDLDGPGGEAARLVQTVKLMAQVKVVRRWKRTGPAPAPPASVRVPAPTVKDRVRTKPLVRIVAIGASTGGPQTLHRILTGLPAGFSVPILVVQHISPGFTAGFVDWLNRSSILPVTIATHKERALPGHVYVAPDGLQMRVDSSCNITAVPDDPENGLRPAVSCLFRSVAQAFGDRAIGVLLTGMGRDGAEELLLLKSKGALTVAQDKESSIVFGMPAEAIKLGGARHVLPPDGIIELLRNSIV